MSPQFAETLKYLRLTGLLSHWDEYLKLAAEKRFSHTALLSHVLQEEGRLRRENARQLRLKCATIKEPWVMETFPFERQPKLNKKKLMALYDSTNYLEQRQNLIFMGETGTGKTGLATAFLIHAINQGRTGRSIRFVDLIAELYTSLADHSQARVLKKYATVDVLLVDEVGTIEVEPVQAGLFFTLMQERHNRKSTFITSNLGFSEWRNFLKNDHLTAALINRLTENTHVFNLKGCVSIRPTLPQDS